MHNLLKQKMIIIRKLAEKSNKVIFCNITVKEEIEQILFLFGSCTESNNLIFVK